MTLINCDINLMFTWSTNCVIYKVDKTTNFAVTDTKLYAPLVSLSAQDNTELLKQLKSDIKRTINWNKYQSRVSTQAQNQYLNYLIDPIFQGVNRLFMLSFEDNTVRDIFFQR